jgi:hypothetical protein
MYTRPENGPFTLEFLSSLSVRRLPLFSIQRVRLLRLDVQEQTLAGRPGGASGGSVRS